MAPSDMDRLGECRALGVLLHVNFFAGLLCYAST